MNQLGGPGTGRFSHCHTLNGKQRAAKRHLCKLASRESGIPPTLKCFLFNFFYVCYYCVRARVCTHAPWCVYDQRTTLWGQFFPPTIWDPTLTWWQMPLLAEPSCLPSNTFIIWKLPEGQNTEMDFYTHLEMCAFSLYFCLLV